MRHREPDPPRTCRYCDKTEGLDAAGTDHFTGDPVYVCPARPVGACRPRHRVSLSAIWVDDAQSRDLDIGKEISRSPAGRMVTMSMTDPQLREALSDARHYSTEWEYMAYPGDGGTYRRLGRSAQAVARKLAKMLT